MKTIIDFSRSRSFNNTLVTSDFKADLGYIPRLNDQLTFGLGPMPNWISPTGSYTIKDIKKTWKKLKDMLEKDEDAGDWTVKEIEIIPQREIRIFVITEYYSNDYIFEDKIEYLLYDGDKTTPEYTIELAGPIPSTGEVIELSGVSIFRYSDSFRFSTNSYSASIKGKVTKRFWKGEFTTTTCDQIALRFNSGELANFISKYGIKEK